MPLLGHGAALCVHGQLRLEPRRAGLQRRQEESHSDPRGAREGGQAQAQDQVSVLVRASERSTERHCHTIVPYHSFNTNNNDDTRPTIAPRISTKSSGSKRQRHYGMGVFVGVIMRGLGGGREQVSERAVLVLVVGFRYNGSQADPLQPMSERQLWRRARCFCEIRYGTQAGTQDSERTNERTADATAREAQQRA